MRVESVAIYPVKGCHRIQVDHAEVQPWGLAHDRRWLVVDAGTGVAVTQRDTAALTQVLPSITNDGIVLRTAGMDELSVPTPVGGGLIDVTVWKFTGAALLAAPAAHEWLSRALARDVRLVWLDDPTRRPVNPAYGRESDRVSFADGYPVSVANRASLSALNDLIVAADPGEAAVPITRFRSNVLISGAPAWAEDEWTGRCLRVGEVTFRVAKPNDRCLVTTIDQETGVKGHEPLRTLGRHRNVDQELRFAAYLIPDGVGTIGIGDAVRAL
jgi:uncharacterized protein YcbX